MSRIPGLVWNSGTVSQATGTLARRPGSFRVDRRPIFRRCVALVTDGTLGTGQDARHQTELRRLRHRTRGHGSTWFNCGGGGYESVPAPTSVGAAFSFTGHCALALTAGATYRFAMGVAIFQTAPGSFLTSFTDTVYQHADVTATVVQSD